MTEDVQGIVGVNGDLPIYRVKTLYQQRAACSREQAPWSCLDFPNHESLPLDDFSAESEYSPLLLSGYRDRSHDPFCHFARLITIEDAAGASVAEETTITLREGFANKSNGMSHSSVRSTASSKLRTTAAMNFASSSSAWPNMVIFDAARGPFNLNFSQAWHYDFFLVKIIIDIS